METLLTLDGTFQDLGYQFFARLREKKVKARLS